MTMNITGDEIEEWTERYQLSGELTSGEIFRLLGFVQDVLLERKLNEILDGNRPDLKGAYREWFVKEHLMRFVQKSIDLDDWCGSCEVAGHNNDNCPVDESAFNPGGY